MPPIEMVVNRFLRGGEARKTVRLTQCGEERVSSGQQFMCIALMTHIENEFISGREKDFVQSDCQLYDP